MFSSLRNALFTLPVIAATLFAGPEIEFDKRSIDCGNAIEGKTDKIWATFAVENTGDSVLKLESVRPDCGCTVVKYDTLIQPGKSAKIEAEVNIEGYRSGPLSKFITVTSNALNEPVVRLTIDATVRPAIDVSENWLTLDKSNIDKPETVFFATQKTDLILNGIYFTASDNMVFLIKNNLVPTDSIRTNGYKVYKVELFSPQIDKSVYGEFVIRTNHPDKKIFSIPGTIKN